MQIDFVVPGLLDAPAPMEISDQAPALAKLMTRGSAVVDDAICVEDWLAKRFGSNAERANFPFAAVAWLAESAAAPAGEYWVRADPVHFSVNRDRMVLLDATQLDITTAQSNAFIESLSAHFKSDGLNFFAPHRERWYLQSAEPIALCTYPVATVCGRNVADYWFDGLDRARWQTRLSEIQMLLHAHPINEARELAGHLPINGVWLWGAGKLPTGAQNHYSQILGNDALSVGFASLSKTRYSDADQFDGNKPFDMATGNTLVLLDRLSASAAYGEWDAWIKTLAALNQTWFLPALSNLKNGRLDSVRIFIPHPKHAKQFTTTRTDLLKFWRRSIES